MWAHLELACALLAAAAAPATAAPAANETCTTDGRVSAFPIRLVKCNIDDLACFKSGRYAFGGWPGEPRCTGLWSQGPCDQDEWLVVDKERFYATGYIRTVCAPLNVCPKDYFLMAFDGLCYSAKEAAANCPKKSGFKLAHNVFGEGECVCAQREPLPVRYCDTVAVGPARGTATGTPLIAAPVHAPVRDPGPAPEDGVETAPPPSPVPDPVPATTLVPGLSTDYGFSSESSSEPSSSPLSDSDLIVPELDSPSL